MVGTPRQAARVRSSVAPRGAYRGVAGRGYPGGPSGLSDPRQWAFLTGGEYGTGPAPATERDAMALPPFGRGVALLCNAVAGTDWQAVRFDPALGVAVRRPDQPSVLALPDPTSTPWHYRWAAIADLILYGNHFALCGSTDAVTRRPGWLVPVHADRVGILMDPETGAVWFVIDGEAVRPYDPNDPPRASVDATGRALGDWTGTLFHVSAGNRSGEILGLGVLAEYAQWLGGAVAAEDHAGAYFAGGALPPAVLQSPTVLTQPQAEALKTSWRTMVSTREPVVLPAGYVLTPIVSDALNAQMVESRQWNAASVAMMLGIPGYKLGLQGPSMTYQNIESADIEFVRDSVDRYAEPLSQAFSQWLMPLGSSVAWQYAGRMRADQKTTAEVLTTYVAAGIMTKDEARAAIGRPPLEESTEETNTPEGVPDLSTPETAVTDSPVFNAPGSGD
jgi:phage portal protein BeeE